MEIMEREVSYSYIPSDVQIAIDTILSYCYHVNLEKQILSRRMGAIEKLARDSEIDADEKATHENTFRNESARLRQIVAQDADSKGAEE